MANSTTRSPMSGGFLLATCIVIGTIAGALRGEASFGFLIGTGVGVAIAVAIWLIDRARTGG